MVSVEVGDKDRRLLVESDSLGKDLSLDSLPAIHQNDRAFPLDGDGWKSPVPGGSRGACPEECYGELDRDYLLLRTDIVLVRSL